MPCKLKLLTASSQKQPTTTTTTTTTTTVRIVNFKFGVRIRGLFVTLGVPFFDGTNFTVQMAY
jgi:hypothetical protein